MPADRNKNNAAAASSAAGGSSSIPKPARGRGGGGGSGITKGPGSGGRVKLSRPKGRRGGYKAYEPPTFSDAESLTMSQSRDPAFAAKLDAGAGRVRSITFKASYGVSDGDLQAIVARPEFAAGLQKISIGVYSENVSGEDISNTAIRALVPTTPHLRILILDHCLRLDDTTLLSILTHCPMLEQLAITGNEYRKGLITKKGLKDMQTQPTVGPMLKELLLCNQSVPENACKACTKARKGLAIKTGETYDYDGFMKTKFALMEDGAGDEVYYGGKMIGMDFGDGAFLPFLDGGF